MENVPSFNQLIQQSIIDNWDLDALTDYKGATLQFHDVARKIEKLHILFENCGVVKGDKIALCGRNSSQWAVAFLATRPTELLPYLSSMSSWQTRFIISSTTRIPNCSS